MADVPRTLFRDKGNNAIYRVDASATRRVHLTVSALPEPTNDEVETDRWLLAVAYGEAAADIIDCLNPSPMRTWLLGIPLVV